LTAHTGIGYGRHEGGSMIGWRPYLFTLLAGALLAIVVFDVSVVVHASAVTAVAHWLHAALSSVSHWISSLSTLDWILVAAVVALLGWGWVRARAFTTLGAIQIDDLACGDTTLEPVSAKATLQQELGRRGLLPPSGVPSGSPSVASIADAIAKAPIAPASWVGALIGLIPLPPSSTGFTISGTLLRTGDDDPLPVRFAYQLVCTGPRRTVHLGVGKGTNQESAMQSAARDIYRRIGEAAPDIYPSWARWCTSDALTIYRNGIDLEQGVVGEPPTGVVPVDPTQAYTAAYRQYLAASQQDPDNMLARLRAANCLERMAAGTEDPNAKFQCAVQALAAYISIRIRQPTIFEAGFRASVLMSVLASEDEERLCGSDLLIATVARFERCTARFIDPHDSPDGTLPPRASTNTITERLQDAAQREARNARHRLRPLWTVWHEGRFRHRFEPRGSERRQLGKALGISKLAQRARREQRFGASGVRLRSEAAQVWWRMLVAGRYMLGRWAVAGWQAHYNAACFYALLPQTKRTIAGSAGARLRRRALRHLARAIDQADGALQCAYVRDEDPDLRVLRELSPQRFMNVVGRICPDDLTIHYMRPDTGGSWVLHVWGDATDAPAGDWSRPLPPVSSDSAGATFRVRIFDENRELRFLAHRGDAKDEPGWCVIPSTLPTSEIRVNPADNVIIPARLSRRTSRRRPSA
jgi:Bacterial pullanase-associated domain